VELAFHMVKEIAAYASSLQTNVLDVIPQ